MPTVEVREVLRLWLRGHSIGAIAPLAQVDRKATVNVAVSLRQGAIANASEWISDRTLSVKKQTGRMDSVSVTIPAGGIAIVELQVPSDSAPNRR